MRLGLQQRCRDTISSMAPSTDWSSPSADSQIFKTTDLKTPEGVELCAEAAVPAADARSTMKFYVHDVAKLALETTTLDVQTPHTQ